MFYQKTNTVGELNTDCISVGNWSRNPQGVLWFIVVWEGITEVTEQGPEETPMTVDDPMNNQEELEDQLNMKNNRLDLYLLCFSDSIWQG